ncbi:hypothetical protein D3C81_1888060 [compost metagenome]
MINTAKLHTGNRFTGHLDSTNTILRIHPGMGGLPEDFHLNSGLCRSGYADSAYFAVGVESETIGGIQMLGIERTGAHES